MNCRLIFKYKRNNRLLLCCMWRDNVKDQITIWNIHKCTVKMHHHTNIFFHNSTCWKCLLPWMLYSLCLITVDSNEMSRLFAKCYCAGNKIERDNIWLLDDEHVDLLPIQKTLKRVSEKRQLILLGQSKLAFFSFFFFFFVCLYCYHWVHVEK